MSKCPVVRNWLKLSLVLLGMAILPCGCGGGREGEAPTPTPPPAGLRHNVAAEQQAVLEGDAILEGSAPKPSAGGGMLVVPKVGIGEVKFGMTLGDVKQLWGEPDRIEGGRVYIYYSKGLNIAAVSETGVVGHAICFAAKMVHSSPFSPLLGPKVKDFQGKTAEGIGIGSTEQAVVQAYGEPPSRHQDEGTLSLTYPDLGMDFTLQGGTVVLMMIRGDKEMLEKRIAELKAQ